MHRFRWNGTNWSFLEGDASGYVVIGQPDGTPPNGGLWGLCDGSVYAVAQGEGTTHNVTTQNLTGGVFVTGDVPAGVVAATPTTFAPGAQTDAESTHVHTVTPPATNSGIDSGTGTSIASGTGAAFVVAAHPHQHTVDIIAFGSGPGTAHAHTMSTVQLNPPTAANGGLPAHIGAKFYIRR
jgi:hypothetical protein